MSEDLKLEVARLKEQQKVIKAETKSIKEETKSIKETRKLSSQQLKVKKFEVKQKEKKINRWEKLKKKILTKKIVYRKVFKPQQMTVVQNVSEPEEYRPIYFKNEVEQAKRSLFWD